MRMPTLLLSVMAATTVAASATAAPADNPGGEHTAFGRVYRELSDSVVRVMTDRRFSTGFIATADGLVVTHADVVRKNTMSVLLPDGRRLKARTLVRDEPTALAVLRLLPEGTEPEDESDTKSADAADAESRNEAAEAGDGAEPADVSAVDVTWPAVPLGDSSTLGRSAMVATIAHPYGSDLQIVSRPSLSVGVVMARGRVPSTLAWEGELLLTDATVNAGSEGGLLVDTSGRAVGVLCKPHYYARTNTALNIALPIEAVGPLLERARTDPDPPIDEAALSNVPTSGFLGVQGDPSAARCRIVAVVPGGPADEAGIRPGDIVTHVNEQRVGGFGDLVRILRATEPGDEATVAVERAGADEPIEVEVTLGRYPEE